MNRRRSTHPGWAYGWAIQAPREAYGQTMIVDLVRGSAPTLPEHPDPGAVTAMRVWHCGYGSLGQLSERFYEATGLDDSFDPNQPRGSVTESS